MKLFVYNTENKYLPIRVHEDDLHWLEEHEFITNNEKEVELTEKGESIFNFKEDLFVEFFSTFPHKVPDGLGSFRILGTSSHDTILGNKIRKKWKTITKGNIDLQENIIKSLKYELNYRKRTNSLQYMQNIDTWLNNGTWEKYIDAAMQEKPQTKEDKLL